MRKVILSVVCFCMAVSLFAGERVRIKLADGKTKFAEYDGTVVLDRNGRVISNTLGGSNYKWEYDENGKVVTDPEFFATYNSSGKMLSFTDRKTNETFRYEYDKNGKKIKETKDGYGVTILYEYDDRGNLVYRENYLQGTAFIYDYDENDNLICKTDQNNQETVYRYDGNNNCIYERGPDGYEYDYEYDGKNRLITVWENKSAKIESYKYNDNDVIVYKCYINPYTGNSREYYYNDNGDIIMEKNGYSDYVEYQYDDDNNLIRMTNCYDEFGQKKIISDFVYTYEFYENGDVYKRNKYKL